MPLLLRHSRDSIGGLHYDSWVAVAGVRALSLDPTRRIPDIAARLERSFMAIRETWWLLCRSLGAEPGASVAVAPTGSPGSELGILLAWSHMACELAHAPRHTLLICDDPWLFRHIAALDGIDAGRAPSLWPMRVRMALRGLLSRIRVALAVGVAAVRLRTSRQAHQAGDTVLMVYGHAASTARGYDAYFGDLMQRASRLVRLLHVDCPAGRALELCQDRRTASLHGWGSLLTAATLPFLRWRPGGRSRDGEYAWLIRRVAAQENGGGSAAMIAWQIHCQTRWLAAARPSRVAWPWENLAWERALCRAARARSVRTIGYQHTVVGPHQINYSPASNWDGLASLPDLVLCNGMAYRDELAAWGVPQARLRIGGALRFSVTLVDRFSSRGPVLVALSSLAHANRALIAAAERLAAAGVSVMVKEHPMYPTVFREGLNLRATDRPIAGHDALRAVLFATGTSGLDALRARVPAFRLMLDDGLAWDVAPVSVPIPTTTTEHVVSAIENAAKPPLYEWPRIFAPVDESAWQDALDMKLAPSAGRAA